MIYTNVATKWSKKAKVGNVIFEKLYGIYFW